VHSTRSEITPLQGRLAYVKNQWPSSFFLASKSSSPSEYLALHGPGPHAPCGERHGRLYNHQNTASAMGSASVENPQSGSTCLGHWTPGGPLRPTHSSRFSFSRCSPHSDRYAIVMMIRVLASLMHMTVSYTPKLRITRVTADWRAQAAGGIGGTDRGTSTHLKAEDTATQFSTRHCRQGSPRGQMDPGPRCTSPSIDGLPQSTVWSPD
jgi:hypothetical protein